MELLDQYLQFKQEADKENKKTKKGKDPSKPKQSISAFFLYSNERQAALLEEGKNLLKGTIFYKFGIMDQRCKPATMQMSSMLIPSEFSLRQCNNPEVAHVIGRLESFNRLYGERSNGLIQRMQDLPFLLRRLVRDLQDPQRFLDRAAIITPADTKCIPDKTMPMNPRRICTSTQVKEVKCILRLLPIWLCTMLSSVVFIQMLSLFIKQGATMNTSIGAFHFPPPSVTAFDIISTSTFIIFYDKLIVPLYVKITKRKPKPPSKYIISINILCIIASFPSPFQISL